jgi:hypothetical protein
MAKATKTIIPPKPAVEEYTITLVLSQEEAETLKGVTERIGGPDDAGTRRRRMMDIGQVLYDVGVRGGFTDYEVEPSNRAIYFKSLLHR